MRDNCETGFVDEAALAAAIAALPAAPWDWDFSDS